MKKQTSPNFSADAVLNTLSTRQRRNLQQKILAWYHAAHRKLPWRATNDPYAIWVSEVMLQQTQTAKVLQYYEFFLKRFPTLAALAEANLDDVLKAWEGMGYYARARNLHRAARQIMSAHAGKLPNDYERLLEITGIGPYTAAAVASIAFNQDCAVLDGNVERVLSRIFHVKFPPKQPANKKIFQQLASGFLCKGRAKDWNQALMELGALICAPQKPLCESCPAQRHCRGYNELENPAQLPVRERKPERPNRHLAVGLVWKGKKLFIDQREERALLGGLWEFPNGKIAAHETPEQTLTRELHTAFGLHIGVDDDFMKVEHGFTHFSMTMHVYQCRWLKGEPQSARGQNWQWVLPEELERFAFSTANRKIISALRQSV